MSLGSNEDFNKLKSQLEAQKEEAAIKLDGALEKSIGEQIQELEAKKHLYGDKVEAAQEIPANMLKQVEDLGGDKNTLAEKLDETTKDIQGTEAILEEKSEKVVAGVEVKKDQHISPTESPEEYLEDLITRRKGSVELGIRETESSRKQMQEAQARGDEDSAKVHRSQMIYWDNFTVRVQKDLRELQDSQKRQKEQKQSAA